MNKIQSLVIITILALTSLSCNTTSMTEFSAIDYNRAATVTIRSDTGMGTGVTVIHNNDVYIWTVAHAVPEHGTIAIQSRVSSVILQSTATIIARDDQVDIALLKLNNKWRDFPVTSIRWTDNYHTGDDIYYIGNVGGRTFDSMTNGIISNDNIYNIMGYRRVIITAPITHGSSGGGVYLSSDHKCIGLVMAMTVASPFQNYNNLVHIVPMQDIRTFALKHGYSHLVK